MGVRPGLHGHRCSKKSKSNAGCLSPFHHRAIHLDKVYIETYRSQEEVGTDLLAATRDFFEAAGVATAGAVTTSLETTPEWDSRSMCFSTDRDRVGLTEATV